MGADYLKEKSTCKEKWEKMARETHKSLYSIVPLLKHIDSSSQIEQVFLLLGPY